MTNFNETYPKYNAEIVAGPLLPVESRIIAQLILKGTDEKQLKHLLTIENVLQKRSPATAIRHAELIKKRFARIERDLLEIIAGGNKQAQLQVLLAAGHGPNGYFGRDEFRRQHYCGDEFRGDLAGRL